MAPRVLTEDQRLIATLFVKGAPQREICRRTGRSKTSVGRIIHAFQDEGTFADVECSGRPRVAKHDDNRLTVAAALVDPFLNAKEICEELSLNISIYIVSQHMRAAGISNCAAAQKPFLTERQHQQCLAFTQDHQHWSTEEWHNVIFSDESTFYTLWDQQRWV